MLGVSTNLGFLRWLLSQPAVRRAATVDTGFVERTWSPELVPPLPAEVARAARAATLPAGPWRDYGTPATVPVTTAGGFVQYDGWQYPLDDDDCANRCVRGRQARFRRRCPAPCFA